MKQYKQKITATLSAILMILTLVGLTTDQAIAQGKSGKGAKGRSGSKAKIVKSPVSKTVTMLDYEGSPIVTFGAGKDRGRKGKKAK